MLQNNKIAEYEQTLKNIENEYLQNAISEYNDFRHKIIDNYEIIKAETREGKRVEKFINETINWLIYLIKSVS